MSTIYPDLERPAADMTVVVPARTLDQFDTDYSSGLFGAYGGEEIITQPVRRGFRVEVFGAPEAVEYVADLLDLDVTELDDDDV